MNKFSLLLASLILSTASINYAETLTFELSPSKDATIHDLIPDAAIVADGMGGGLFSGLTIIKGDVEGMRSMIEFDVAAELPADLNIESARLEMTVVKSPNTNMFDFTLHVATTDWNEGPASTGPDPFGSGAAASAGDSTWEHTNFDTEFWNTPGGDFLTSPSATTTVAGVSDDPYIWDSSEMVADIQNWIENPETNFGWFILGNENRDFQPTVRAFASREFFIASARPKLIIEGTLPPSPSDLWMTTD